jgi:hypothetical protein
MATLALSVVGGLVGGALGGPVGAAFGRGLGALAGAAIDASLFAPKPPGIEGPRLSDLSVTTSAYGQPIPLAWGQRVRLGGNVIWATPLQETATRRKSGGKGGAGKQSSTTYSYSTSFAIVFCEGPITGITRIWGDGKLLYDSTATPPCARAGAVRIHLGTETQLADSRIAAEVGAADCPAYRGLAYAVFEDLQLADFGNRIPQITAELALASPAVSIAAAALAARAGVTTLDVASVAEPLAGFVVARQTTARAAIEALMMGAALTAAAVPGGARSCARAAPCRWPASTSPRSARRRMTARPGRPGGRRGPRRAPCRGCSSWSSWTRRGTTRATPPAPGAASAPARAARPPNSPWCSTPPPPRPGPSRRIVTSGPGGPRSRGSPCRHAMAGSRPGRGWS